MKRTKYMHQLGMKKGIYLNCIYLKMSKKQQKMQQEWYGCGIWSQKCKV